ncbi:MAG: hypothetical protein AAB646_03205 [Patescibacteria group bacterium]
MASIEDLKKDFSRLIKEEKLSHSYLLFGSESGAEKFLFSKELANFLENKKWQVSERPLLDALMLSAQSDSGIEMVRSAANFLWQKPAVSTKRTLIIDKADHLTLPAQNAILKIAEEPPRHALIILNVRNYETLLPALQSRFQKIYVNSNFQFSIFPATAGPRCGGGNFQKKDEFKILKFMKAATSEKKEIIKNLVDEEKENSGMIEEFVTSLIAELRKDPIKNYQMLKNILERWTLINQFNVNKRLQLEAALIE